MTIIMEADDGQSYGPGQPYGYQGQYQGQRQPGLETANMRSVPERTRSLRPPGQPSSGLHTGYGGGPANIKRPNMYDVAGPSKGGIFGGNNSKALAANDMMFDYYNNQPGWAGQLQSEIGGAGEVIPINKQTDTRVEERLWKEAVNSLPIGTPQPQLIEEWEKLKDAFYRRKYGE